jgi:hypothetical protein
MGFLSSLPRGSVLSPILQQTQESQLEIANLSQNLYHSLTVPQRVVWDSDHRFKLLCSGRRFGKTYLCIARLIA